MEQEDFMPKVKMIVITKNFIKRGPLEIGAGSMFKVEHVEEGGLFIIGTPMYNNFITMSENLGWEIGDQALHTKEIEPYFKGTIGNILNDSICEAKTRYGSDSKILIEIEVLEQILRKHIKEDL